MLAKVSRKNQLTLPKKAVHQLGFDSDEEKYVDVVVQGNTLVIKPVTVTIEEKLSAGQMEKLHDWSLSRSSGDRSFSSAAAASRFLKRRLRKK